MSLKPRFLILAASLIVFASVASWVVFQRIAESIIEQWGARVAEIQVRYDSSRLLRPLQREMALARQMADSQVLRRWALDPDNTEFEAEAIDEMESFRRNFQDGSYFVALLESGAYYHNNAADDYAGQQLRYHLNADSPADAWFFELVREGRDFHLNVNPDVELGVTKLWIDVLMRDGERILAIVGTGLALDDFLREIVDIRQPGITTLFADHNGAIQLYRDQQYIDFASIVKSEGEANTVDVLLDTPADRERVRAMMRSLSAGADQADGVVMSDFVTVGGKRHLAGIAYLPEIDWYEITLLDLDVLMPVSSFMPVAAVFALTLLITLLLFHFALGRLVFNPVAALEAAMMRVRDGDLRPVTLPSGQGEIGRLIGHFGAMADAVRETTHELEGKVRERTEALHKLARIDALTGLANRRGMSELLDEEIQRAQRQQSTFGVIWLDVDCFKEINDSLGHAVGDRVLEDVASLLRANVRPYDHAARWGGDEFLVLLSPCDGETLEKLAERMRAGIAAHAKALAGKPITVSVGACLALPGQSLERILQLADEALYAAKDAGRNALRMARSEYAETADGAASHA